MDPLPEGEHTISAASERGKQIHAEILAAAERVATEFIQPIDKDRWYHMLMPEWMHRRRRKRRPEVIKLSLPVQWRPRGPHTEIHIRQPEFNVEANTHVRCGDEQFNVFLNVEQENTVVRIDVDDPLELAHELIQGMLWREAKRAEQRSATIKEQEGDAAQTEA